ncbi:MAG: hypothetical protein SCK70_14145 [bacterium]|nr:hypothetical protein [bacterium]
MAKDRSFAAKLAKGTHEGKKCPVCGDVVNMVMMISSEQRDKAKSWRFNEKFVAVCKCNEKEVYA